MIVAVERDSHVGFKLTKETQTGLGIGRPIDGIDLKIRKGF